MNNTIFVNQIGYKTSEKKIAFVDKANYSESKFEICTLDGKSVYSGTLANAMYDDLSRQETLAADFSDFKTPGTYKIVCGNHSSYSFAIGEDVYNPVYKSILEYFTLSRCGHRTVKSDWATEDCHTSTAEIYGTKEKKQVIGGWHDAGDYGRYVVAGSKTIMDLLQAYKAAPEFKGFDILEEVRFELEWMLQMQREDGGVYHKISCYNFCPFIMPHEEKQVQVLAPVSTAATADFAGCLAFASTIYESKDKAFADKLLEKAILAQKYLDSKEDELYENPAEITTGSYSDKDVRDERFFALCALFAATKNQEYLSKAMEYKNEDWGVKFFWGMVNGYGVEILLQNKDLISDKASIEKLEETVIQKANNLKEIVNKAAFRTAMSRVFWGSNGAVCDDAHVLMLAWKITGDSSYYDAAKAQLNYVLGCNPLAVCYVTGFGENTVSKPHHRPSGAAKKTMPGMLSGGPSAGLQDAVAREKLTGKAPLSCFIDHMGSYSTNEVAIYWNSPLVLLIAFLGLI